MGIALQDPNCIKTRRETITSRSLLEIDFEITGNAYRLVCRGYHDLIWNYRSHVYISEHHYFHPKNEHVRQKYQLNRNSRRAHSIVFMCWVSEWQGQPPATRIIEVEIRVYSIPTKTSPTSGRETSLAHGELQWVQPTPVFIIYPK